MITTDRFRVDGKVALITGSSRGLGAGMALALAQAGAGVILHDRTEPSGEVVEAVAAASGRCPTLLTADLADRVRRAGPDSKIEFSVRRDGRERVRMVHVGQKSALSP